MTPTSLASELLDRLTALRADLDDLLFVPAVPDLDGRQTEYSKGCEDTKRDVLQLVDRVIGELRGLR